MSRRSSCAGSRHSGMLAKARELDRADRREEARMAFRAFLDREPDHAEAWADFGGLLMVMDRLDEAEQACRRALAIDPDQALAMVNLAHTLLHLDRVDEAQLLSRRLLARDPWNVDALLALADGFLKTQDLGAARTTLERLLAFQPSHEMAWARLNNIHIWQGDWTEMRKGMERQLDVFSGPEAEYERSHLRLLFGEMAQGWVQFESRLLVPGRIRPSRNFTEPRWNGEPFHGRTLLVHWEQGFGDTLMFIRYLPRVKALGGAVILVVQPELVDLAATCPGADRVIPEGAGIPPFDLQVSLMSLPAVFRTDLSSIPAEVPYLDVPSRVPNRSSIAEVLATLERGIRIGIVWAGNPNHKQDAERSMPAEAFRPLGGLLGVFWHSFQIGRNERLPLRNLVSLAPLLSSFSDTAYALSGMDLVITVDTALAHLAGAMGIPTLLLLPFQPDFRWMLHREDSPWYPTLRIYRQSAPGDWTSVIQRVLADLGGQEGR